MDNWTGSDSFGTTATELQSLLVRRYTGLTIANRNFSVNQIILLRLLQKNPF